MILDLTWIGVIAKSFYAKYIGYLMRSDVNWFAAIAFYLLFMVGLIVFVIQPALQKGSWIHALLYGLLFGAVTYAAYDLTNLAIVKDWPITVTIVDIAWGAVVSGAVCLATYLIAVKFGF